MVRIGVANPLIPADTGNPGSGGVEPPLRLSQHGCMPVYIQFNADSSYEQLVHKRTITETRTKIKDGAALLPICSSPCLKAGVSTNGGN
jgi:hypothetical protein